MEGKVKISSHSPYVSRINSVYASRYAVWAALGLVFVISALFLKKRWASSASTKPLEVKPFSATSEITNQEFGPLTFGKYIQQIRNEYIRRFSPHINIDFHREPFNSVIEQIPMPDGPFGQFLHELHNKDTSKVPRPFRFFDILTSPYKPLGYWGTSRGLNPYTSFLPSEATLKWVIDENSKISGNRRLKRDPDEMEKGYRTKFFYNENYLKKLLELNFHIFDGHDFFQKAIFHENGLVKEDGINFFIRHHWDFKEETHGPSMLAVVHAAFGDAVICGEALLGYSTEPYHTFIKIPDEPGLRDVIALHQQFPLHQWRAIQALLRTFNDVKTVEERLRNLAPGPQYYVTENNEIVAEDISCFSAPILVRLSEVQAAEKDKSKPVRYYAIKGAGNPNDPYRAERFIFDRVVESK